jgi:hypothetical protein
MFFCHKSIECVVVFLLTTYSWSSIQSASRELPRTDSLKRKIDAVDAEIDAAVYRLYGLTEEKIKVVEGK